MLVDTSAPRRAKSVVLAMDWSAERAILVLLGECGDQIAANAALAAISETPEAVHQLRVGLRRLRSVERIGRLGFSGNLGDVAEAAKRLGQNAGAVRDLDVARKDLLAPAQAAWPAERGFTHLDNALAERAAFARRALRRTLAGPETQSFLRMMANLPDWSETSTVLTTGVLAERALDAAWSRTVKRAGQIELLDIPARHDLRKALKHMRYTAELLGSLYPEAAVQRWRRPLKAMQETLGDLNDLAAAEELFLGPHAIVPDHPDAHRAVGLLLGRLGERADATWVAAQDLWLDLRTTQPFWR